MNSLLAKILGQQSWTDIHKNRRAQVAGIFVFALTGTLLVNLSHATTSFFSVETEDGNLSGMTAISDSSASGGKSVKFGQRPTYYVATTGSDSANGSSGTPWRTIQHAVDTAPTSSKIEVASGSYQHFSVTRANLMVTGAPSSTVIVSGGAGIRDTVLVAANGITLSNFKVSGCVPASNPAGGLEDSGSSGVRLDNGTSGAVLQNLTISDSDTTLNSQGLPFGCYAISAHSATTATIQDNDLYKNGYGILVVGGGTGFLIKNNTIHDNDVIIRNNTLSNDDFGGIGIGFVHVSSTPGPIAEGNTIYTNQGPSNDYGTDGGAFEVYDASNLMIRNNAIYNNENILETGTNSGGACSYNSFTGNTASGKTSGSTITQSIGMILRCADHMTIDSNTFTKINWWVFDIENDATFGGSIDRMAITNNTVDQTPPCCSTSEKTFSLNLNPSGKNLTINNNHYHFQNQFANDWNGNNVTTLTTWRTLTGFDTASSLF